MQKRLRGAGFESESLTEIDDDCDRGFLFVLAQIEDVIQIVIAQSQAPPGSKKDDCKPRRAMNHN